MKNKFIILLLTITLSLFAAGCGSNSSGAHLPSSASLSSETPAETSDSTEASDSSETSDNSETSNNSETSSDTPDIKTSLADLEQYLLDKGLLTGERSEVAAAMVGAVSGFKYGENLVEIYEFDETSEAYKNLEKTNTLTVEGFGTTLTPAAVNGPYVLIFSNNSSVSQKITDAFNSYGK